MTEVLKAVFGNGQRNCSQVCTTHGHRILYIRLTPPFQRRDPTQFLMATPDNDTTRRLRRRHMVVPTSIPSAVPPVPLDEANSPTQPVVPARNTQRQNRGRGAPSERRRGGGAAGARTEPEAQDTEFINIDLSDKSTTSEEGIDSENGQLTARDMPAAQTVPNPPRARVGTTPGPLAAATTPNAGGNTTRVNPLATGGRTGRAPPTSADIHHFFTKAKEQQTFCNVCQ